jgi:proline dehydrogenase
MMSKTKNQLSDSVLKLDFSNTEIAFAYKSDRDLKKAAWLYSLMNKTWLVNPLSDLGLLAMKLNVPLTKTLVRETMFRQFVGGRTLLESTASIEKLYEYNIQSVLDYGAEAKTTEHEFNKTMNENIRAIEFAKVNASIPVVVSKISGIARFGLLEAIQKDRTGLSKSVLVEYRNVLKRIDSICYAASVNGVSVMIDAEETWIQDTIDHIANLMMKRYNKERVVVYNIFQMYRHDRLNFLTNSYDKAKEYGYLLGAKLVRGAYMEKEGERAKEKGYPTPIQPSKKATDDAYNMALRFCIDNYESIASCAATHNEESSHLQAEIIDEKGIQKNHPHLNFCQLYGMSDNLTFNLSNAGYNVAKYMVYGQVDEVFPYLIRRAKENTAVSGDMSREYGLVKRELDRRGI